MVSSVIAKIEANYERMSPTDKTIADFFVSNREDRDFCVSKLSKQLFVSKSAFSRFAERIGFAGYREFLLVYENELKDNIRQQHFNSLTQRVLYTYSELQEKAYTLIDEEQIGRVSEMIEHARKVFVYGYANSGLVAQEFKLRFMRLGLDVEAVTDDHLMSMEDALMKPDDLFIALSISSYSMVEHIKRVHQRKVPIVLMTANILNNLATEVDETVLCPSKKNLEVGNVISPQFPLLLLVDVVYAYYLAQGTDYKNNLLQDTVDYLKKRNEERQSWT